MPSNYKHQSDISLINHIERKSLTSCNSDPAIKPTNSSSHNNKLSDGIYSFEQRSSTDGTHAEIALKPHRLIIVDSFNPGASWSTSGQIVETHSLFKWLHGSGNVRLNLNRLGSSLSDLRSRKVAASSSAKLTASSSSISVSGGGYHLGPYPSNEWRTSKYTLLTFLPRNLFEQFRRLANFYFLVTALIQIILPYSPVGPFTSLVPLIFVVGVTSIKQAYEDYLRHVSDSELNNRICRVVRGNNKIVKIRSKDIRVGDIVYVNNNEEIPCDMILLAGSGSNADKCYITTSNLDGETNLKSRNCTCLREQLGTIEHILGSSLLIVECELPNATLYEFNGFLRSPKNKITYDYMANADAHLGDISGPWNQQRALDLMGRLQIILTPDTNSSTKQPKATDIHEIPLDISNLLPRASRLRNTNHIYGLAVYTGPDTKLAQNLHVKPNKFSSTEAKVNIFLLVSFIFLSMFTLISTFNYKRPSSWHLRYIEKEDGKIQIGLAHFLLYNYLMPISLYVTLEFVKFFGTMAVTEDNKMRVKKMETINTELSKTGNKTDKNGLTKRIQKQCRVLYEYPKCNSSDLNEELGQIEILFSDKTGTLTENKMTFKAASVNGILLRDIDSRLYKQTPSDKLSNLNPLSIDILKQMKSLKRGRHTLIPSLLSGARSPVGRMQQPTSASSNSTHSDEPIGLPPAQPLVSPRERFSKLLPSIELFNHRQKPDMSEIEHIKRLENHLEIVEFFVALCLCSNITLNENEPLKNCIENYNQFEYTAASPDEESFISSANQYGISLCKSDDLECYILIKKSNYPAGADLRNGTGSKIIIKPFVDTKCSNNQFYVRHFKKLALLEFNSSRKRMSVICEDCDNKNIIMISKGSEELLDCCDLSDITGSVESQKKFKLTLALFEAFSRSGLRTLLVARREIHSEEFKRIERTIKDIRMSIQNREQLLENFYSETEQKLSLLGATAVEDSLQHGVPETIANLKAAGIKVWLLTGDKVETALSVSQLCNLLDNKQTLFSLVRQRNFRTCQQLINQFVAELKQNSAKKPEDINGSNWKQTQFALIADGRSLHYAMRHSRAELSFICRSCDCVLGCRLSPLQKAEVVSMMKEASDKPITAAIGDGANDVGMIQEAHVGIGLSGKEGRQAVNGSDFAIGKFNILNRLLFVHGHLFYHRTANIIHYFFYKNFLFMAPQFLYSFYNLASAQSIYSPLMMVGFNLFWTSIPILLYGLTEYHIDDRILETYPQIYAIYRKNVLMRLVVFIKWTSLGFLQGVIVFYILYFIWGSHTPLLETGHSSTMNGYPMMVFSSIVILANLRLYFMSHCQTILFHIITIVSIITLPISLHIYGLFNWAPTTDNSFYNQVSTYLESTNFWLAILISSSAALLPEVIWHIKNQIEFYRMLVSKTTITSKTVITDV